MTIRIGGWKGRLALLVTLLLMVKGGGQEKESREELLADFRIEKKVVYKTVAGKSLSLLFIFPKNKPKDEMPVMLFTHGGGWSGGDVYNILKPAFLGTLRKLSDSGVACVAVQYRRTRGDVTAVESVQDCQDAARFLVKHHEQWQLDPERMGVWGGSAGGHLALMTALANDDSFEGTPELQGIEATFRCVVAYFPMTSFERRDLLVGSVFEKPESLVPMLGGLPDEKPLVAKKLSPVEYVSSTMPPVLLIHGEKDKTIPIAESELFLKIGQKMKAPVTLLRVRGAGHSFGGKKISPSMEEVNERAFEFMRKNLSVS